jgi:hypothetical protein
MLALAAFGTLFLAVLIGATVLISVLRRAPAEILLPDTPAEESPARQDEEPEGVRRVLVTPDTVQAVIATLERPASYSRDMMVERFWQGGNAVDNLSATVTDGALALKSSSGGITKNIIVTDKNVYIWYAGDRTPYVGKIESPEDARRAADEYQMLPTYEDALRIDKKSITDAGYAEYGGEDCIFIEYTSGRLGYRAVCYISVELGLLTGVNEYDGETLIYKMTAGECDTETPDGDAFTLPDGTNAIFAAGAP